MILKLPGLEDVQNLRFVVAVEILTSAGAAHIALSAALRRRVFPDVVGQTPVEEGDTAAVILLVILKGDILGFQVILNLDKTHG